MKNNERSVIDTHFQGAFADALSFITENQLLDTGRWKEFVRQYRIKSDSANRGWRCEYFGKMMRGACLVFEVTHDEKLYSVLREAVEDLLSAQDSDGRFSTYTEETEFSGWDMWGRKYIMLALEFFLPICRAEELKARIITALCRHADRITEKTGVGEGKIPVSSTSDFWMGVNALSILEPFVKLYNITGEQRYLDYASELVAEGESLGSRIFTLAAEDKFDPYEYPETKAYETMSCFQGLAEYYFVTGEEKYRRAVMNFARRLLSADVTVIGCCGCTHELFDHSSFAQTDDAFQGIMQETCVSVTLIGFCLQLLRLTGDPVYADTVEISLYNDWLGSLNTHKNALEMKTKDGSVYSAFLPFDSYSPLRDGVRGKKVGGFQKMENGSFYGCCACIGAAGIGYVAKESLVMRGNSLYLNFYQDGEYNLTFGDGKALCLFVSGGYPYRGEIVIKLTGDTSRVEKLFLRIPAYSKRTRVSFGRECLEAKQGYLELQLDKGAEEIHIGFDMRIFPIFPEKGAPGENEYIAFRRGCITLAADARLGYTAEEVIAPELLPDGSVKTEEAPCPEIPDARLCLRVGNMRLTDYASAGQTYSEESLMAAWIHKR